MLIISSMLDNVSQKTDYTDRDIIIFVMLSVPKCNLWYETQKFRYIPDITSQT